MVVLIGESAGGKSLTEKTLKSKYGFKRITSYTTRKPREGEVDGVDYHYISVEDFLQMRFDGRLAEYTEYRGNYYGIAVEDCLDDAVVVVEPNGFNQLLQKSDLNITSFYIYAPKEVREKRMRERGDAEEEIQKRLVGDEEVFKGVNTMVNAIIDNSTDDSIDSVCLSILAVLDFLKDESEEE